MKRNIDLTEHRDFNMKNREDEFNHIFSLLRTNKRIPWNIIELTKIDYEEDLARGNNRMFPVGTIKDIKFTKLADPEYAKLNPYEYQKPQNLVYCNLLEHFLLHIKIVSEQLEEWERDDEEIFLASQKVRPLLLKGIGGIVNYFIPQLNDLYSGYVGPLWLQHCFDVVKENEDVYLWLIDTAIELTLRGIELGAYPKNLNPENWKFSYYEQYGSWSSKNNARIIKEIQEMFPFKLTKDYIRSELKCIYGGSITDEDIENCISMIEEGDCSHCGFFSTCAVMAAPWIMERYNVVE